jgi:hypothetical protein
MTEPFPFALLSPLRLDLTSLLQSKEIALAAEGKNGGQKKRRMMNIMEAIEQTPPQLRWIKLLYPSMLKIPS